MSNNLRKVEIFEDNYWKEIEFEDLKVGNLFRMFEPTGEPVVGDGEDIDGTTEWYVTRAPYQNENGVLTVVMSPILGG